MTTKIPDPLLETLKATSATAAQVNTDPLVLKPEWGVKDKNVDDTKVRKFLFTFDEESNTLTLHVNNELYREFNCKDSLNASIKFHEALERTLSCFTAWKIYDRN